MRFIMSIPSFEQEVHIPAGPITMEGTLALPDEAEVYENRFNIGLLTRRLEAATQWLKDQPQARGLALGYFGASTGAAAALWAAADLGAEIGAVVSRGGRPDMAGPGRHPGKEPPLLPVGGPAHI